MPSFAEGSIAQIVEVPKKYDTFLASSMPTLTDDQKSVLKICRGATASPNITASLAQLQTINRTTFTQEELTEFTDFLNSTDANLVEINYSTFLKSYQNLPLLRQDLDKRTNIIGILSVSGALQAKQKYESDTLALKTAYENAKQNVENISNQLLIQTNDKLLKKSIFNNVKAIGIKETDSRYSSAQTESLDADNLADTTKSALDLARNTADTALKAFNLQQLESESARTKSVYARIRDLDNLQITIQGFIDILSQPGRKEIVVPNAFRGSKTVTEIVPMSEILSDIAGITISTNDINDFSNSLNKILLALDKYKMIVYEAGGVPRPVANELVQRKQSDDEVTQLVSPGNNSRAEQTIDHNADPVGYFLELNRLQSQYTDTDLEAQSSPSSSNGRAG
jgi:hypothetical protein